MARKYNASLFGCCSPFGVCMKAFCCPCVVFGRNHYRIEHGTEQGYSTLNGWCAAWCLLGMVGNWGCILQCLDRQKMQEKHNLEGSGFGACCTSCCCGCCELVQTHKELGYIQVSQNDHAAVKGYQQQPGMVAEQKTGTHNPQAYQGNPQVPAQQYPMQPQPHNGSQHYGGQPHA